MFPTTNPASSVHLGANESTMTNPVAPTTKKGGSHQRARGVSLLMLVSEKILEPGKDVLTMEYLGEKYTSDLLDNGKILWNEKQFASPSAWAIYVKKQIDPAKKSGCGWNSVKYKGKKLDTYKTIYNQKYKPAPALNSGMQGMQVTDENSKPSMIFPQHPLKYSKLKELAMEIHPNTSVECERFDGSSGKIQPFLVSVSSNCLLLISFHCHLTHSEVVGYLGGKWDHEKQCLNILQAFPCRCRLGDRQNAAITEEQINIDMQKRGLTKVGWYHSHPASCAEPTLRDIEFQEQYQKKFSVNNPVLAMICSPFYEPDNPSVESSMNMFWVDPQKNHSTYANTNYGMPMRCKFSESQDISVTPDLLQELGWLVEFYSVAPDLVNFSKIWKGNITYMERLKIAVHSKMPKDGDAIYLMQLLQKLATTSQ